MLDLQPEKLFINIGTNDMNAGARTDEQIVADYRALLETIRSRLPETDVFVLSYYPINELMHAAGAWQSGRTNARIAQLNGMVRQMAQEMGLVWIDVSSALSDETGNLRAEFAAPDGVHILPHAYDHVLQVLLPYMR